MSTALLELPRQRRRSGLVRPLVPAEVDARSHTEVRVDSVETGVCLRCGRSHAPANRQRLIRPMRDLPTYEVAALWPCFYPRYRPGTASEAMLMRDLRVVRGSR